MPELKFFKRHKHSISGNKSTLDLPSPDPSKSPSLSPFQLDHDHETVMFSTQLESLNAQVDQLQSQLVGQINELENDKRRLQAASEESDSLKAVNEYLQNENKSLTNRVSDLERDVQDRTHQVTALDFTNSMNDIKIQAQQDELQQAQEHINKYKEWGASVRETHRIQQEKIKAGKEELKWALSQAGEPVVEAWKSTKTLEKQIEDLENAAKAKDKEFEKLQQTTKEEIEKLEQTTKEEIEKVMATQKDLEEQIHKLNTQLDESKGRETALTVVQGDLTSEIASIKVQLSEATSTNSLIEAFTSQGLSPRKVILLQLIGATFPAAADRTSNQSRPFSETKQIEHLSNQSLDMPLETEEALKFRDSVNKHFETQNISDALTIKICAICKIQKLATKSNTDRALRSINEFSPRFSQTTCCSNSICNACLTPALIKSVQTDWWHNLDTQQWLKCPVPTCTSFAPVRHVGELTTMVNGLGRVGPEAIASYERASLLRSALQGLAPRPTPAALNTAARLHQRLFDRGHMRGFFDPSFGTATFDQETGRTRGFEAGKLIMCDLDVEDDKVPLFTKFFIRSTEPKECCICAESYHEINFSSEEEWVESCSGFAGKWMWRVLLFPTKVVLDKCEHTMDTCKNCFEMNLASELEAHGRNGCDRLTCPQCNRKLDESEIQVLASPEAAEKFDHYQLLNLLATEENFRWCLREGCENGQLYDDNLLENRVLCESCQFEMCFKHQVPWHEGLTCEQFDSQRAHGDPNHGETEQWITSHTKRCPGPNCGVNVEKDGGCFHMTCRSCNHEFCWECLAGWSAIVAANGDYNQNAHGEDCFFRTNDLQPTQIAGNDLQAALNRRRRNHN